MPLQHLVEFAVGGVKHHHQTRVWMSFESNDVWPPRPVRLRVRRAPYRSFHILLGTLLRGCFILRLTQSDGHQKPAIHLICCCKGFHGVQSHHKGMKPLQYYVISVCRFSSPWSNGWSVFSLLAAKPVTYEYTLPLWLPCC